MAMMKKLLGTTSMCTPAALMAPDTPVSPAPGNGEDKGPPKLNRQQRRANASEKHAPLPDKTEPASKLAKGERTAKDYDISDIIADDSDEDEFSEPRPVRHSDHNETAEGEIHPGTSDVPHDRLRHQAGRRGPASRTAEHVCAAEEVRSLCGGRTRLSRVKNKRASCGTLQGQASFDLSPATSDLSNNSYNSTRRDAIAAATKGWVKIRTDLEAQIHVPQTQG
jgi:hypothetical protein